MTLRIEIYAPPRVHAELRAKGIRCRRKQVERLMRKAGLKGYLRARRKRTSRREGSAMLAPDLVCQDFTAVGPDRLWVADIIYMRTDEGFVYLAFVLDAYSRRLFGWAMETHSRTELAVGALQMALWRKKPSPGLIPIPTRERSTPLCPSARSWRKPAWLPRWAEWVPLTTTPWRKALATLKTELSYRDRWPTRKAARTAILEYPEGFYNRTRLHSTLDHKSSAEFEEGRMQETTAT